MPTIKVILEKGETPEQAENLLFKAFEAQRTGEIHQDEFNDPAMRDLILRMEAKFKEEHDAMIQEIIQALEEEHSNGNE